jgi:hypothetical protein
VPPKVLARKAAKARFTSASSLAKWVAVVFAFFIIVAVVAIVSDIFQIRLLSRVIDGEWVPYWELVANDDRQRTIGYLYLAAWAATAVIFLVWVYRAHSNLAPLGARELRHSPGWAVGWFFIPILSWFMPFIVTKEIWRASDPDFEGETDWKQAPLSPLLVGWWALFLGGSLVGIVIQRIDWGETPAGLLTGTWAVVGFLIAGIFGALVTIGLVRSISQRQDEKHRRAQVQPSEIQGHV